MNLNQNPNAYYYQQASMGQQGGYYQQVVDGPHGCYYQVSVGQNGGCYQQMVVRSNGNCCQQVYVGPNCGCHQQIVMNSNGSNCQQMVMNMNENCSMTSNNNNNYHMPSGRIIREKRDLPLFEGIHVNGSIQIFITQSNDQSITVEDDENYVRFVDTRVQNKILYVSNHNSFNSNNQPTVYISVKEVQQISVYGASSMTGQSVIQMNNLNIDVHGSSHLDLQLNVQQVNLRSSGSSDVVLSGIVNAIESSILGSSNLDASGLIADDFNISMNGSSSANINVRNHLGYDVSGASSLTYGSNPNIIRASCSFASSIHHNYS